MKTTSISRAPQALPGFPVGTWRQDFLRLVLLTASAVGFIILIGTLFNPINLLNELLYAATYAIVLMITFVRFPVSLRAGILLVALYGLGVLGLVNAGVGWNASLFFLTLIVLSGLIFSARAGLIALLICLISIGTYGWLVVTGQYPLLTHAGAAVPLLDSLLNLGAVLVLSILLLAALYFLQTEVDGVGRSANRTVGALQADGKKLESQAASLLEERELRNKQLRATLYFNSQIAEIQDLDLVLQKIVESIAQRFDYLHVGLFLLDSRGKTAFLQAASSSQGQEMVRNGYRVILGERGNVARAAEQGRLYQSSAPQNMEPTGSITELPRVHADIALPLIARGKVIGVLDIQAEQSNAFGQSQMEILQLLADKAATSIDSLRLRNESQAFVNEFELLNAQQMRASWRGYVKNQKLVYQFTPSGIKPVSPSNPNLKSEDGLRVPLVLRGQEIGWILLRRQEDAPWSQDEQDLADKVSIQVSLALENRRLLTETRERAIQEQTMSEISARLNRSLDIDTLLQTAARELGGLPEVAEVSVILGDNEQAGQ